MYSQFAFQKQTASGHIHRESISDLGKVIKIEPTFQVDDGEYFQTLPENSIFMFLRTGESWHPTGSDSIKAGKLHMDWTDTQAVFV